MESFRSEVVLGTWWIMLVIEVGQLVLEYPGMLGGSVVRSEWVLQAWDMVNDNSEDEIKRNVEITQLWNFIAVAIVPCRWWNE